VEVWLHPNRRALTCGLIAACGTATAATVAAALVASPALRTAAAAVAALAAAVAAGLLRGFCLPRIAWDGRYVLFRVKPGPPAAIPLPAVEAFFLGQGPATAPLAGRSAETVNLVARISQKFPEYARGPVRPALAGWCDGYLTIRGAWCEPLTAEVVRRLNRRLRELQLADAAPRAASPKSTDDSAAGGAR